MISLTNGDLGAHAHLRVAIMAAHLGALMPKRWLQPRKRSSPARWAVGCHDCGTETSFTGEASNVQAWLWYDEHFCPEEPREDLAYLALPSLDMTADQLLKWARRNASISATWVLDHFGEGESIREST